MKKILIFLLLLSQIVNAQNKVTLTGGTGTGGGMSGPVSVTTGNGFAGSVLNSTSAPEITISTNQTGLLYGNGTSATGTKIGPDFFRTSDSLRMYVWANVLDYGAVADGTTNNTTAFTAAVATGKPVYVPSGTFLLSTTVTLQTNQTLFGDGWTSIIKVTANTRAIAVDSGSHVRDLKFVGNGKAGSGAFNAGVFLNSAVGFLVDHVMCTDFAGDVGQNGGGGIYGASIHTSNSDGGMLSNIYLFNNDVGLNLAQRAEYVTINNIIAGANNTGVCLGAGNITINGGVVQNNTIGIKAVNGTNVAHNTVNNLLLNHNGLPLDIADATHLLGYTFNNLMCYYGYIKIANSSNIKFNNCHFNFIDSVVLDNATYLTRIGGWWGLNSSGNKIAIRLYNGAEDFAVIGETRYHADSVNNWIRQIHADTISFNGPMMHTGITPASSSSSDSVWVKSSTGLWKLRAQSDISGGGGANTALSNLASVLVNADLDPGSNNSRDIGDGTTSWKDIYAYSFNVRNGSGSGLHTSYTNYSGTPSNGLPPSTGFFVNRVSTGEASSATPTPTGDGLTNFYQLTALAANATFQTPSGSVIGEHNLLWIIIEDNGTPRTLSFNGSYVAGSDIPLPTTTVAGESMELQFRCHGGTIWRLVGRTGGF